MKTSALSTNLSVVVLFHGEVVAVLPFPKKLPPTWYF